MKAERGKSKRVLSSILEKAKTLPPGIAISTVQLFLSAFTNEKQTEMQDLFEQDGTLFRHAEDTGRIRNMSKHWMKKVRVLLWLCFFIQLDALKF